MKIRCVEEEAVEYAGSPTADERRRSGGKTLTQLGRRPSANFPFMVCVEYRRMHGACALYFRKKMTN
jgi:hypothetical protein